MNEELKLLIDLLKTDTSSALNKFKSQGKKTDEIENYRKEFNELDRNQRETQVDRIQQNKTVGEKSITAVKVPLNYPKKIVNTSVAFEVGEPVTLVPQIENATESQLAKLIQNLWKANRIDNVIQKALVQLKSETQVAMLFYIKDIKEGSVIQKILNFIGIGSQKKEVKVSLLKNTAGKMYPYFDSYGDLIAFTWEFATKENDKEVTNTWIYTDDSVYKSTAGATPTIEKHGFDKIPVVYRSQDKPEWFDVQALIDRYEVTLSKLCDSNDRTGYPLLKTYGKLNSLPDKNDNGKVLNFPMEWDADANKHVHGDAEFLTYAHAPEAVKLELETIDDGISYISSTPVTSLNKLKGIGNVAEKTVKLMFLDPIIKAKSNEGDNRTMIERIINVITSGIVTTTNTSMKTEAQKLYFDIQFNSILPSDLAEASDIISKLVTAKAVSKKTAVEYLGLNPDTQDEIDMIAQDYKVEPDITVPPTI